MTKQTNLVVASLVLPWSLAFFVLASPAPRAADAAAEIVARIMRADYEGDRAALQRLEGELGALGGGSVSGVGAVGGVGGVEGTEGTEARKARLHYWRGYALMRAGQNGVNDGVAREELLRQFEDAFAQFEASRAADPAFEDATVNMLTCLQAMAFLNAPNPERLKEVLPRLIKGIDDVKRVRADNPRRAWVLGAQEWYAPPGTPQAEIERKQASAIAMYERALPAARAQRHDRASLDPTWGEPELLMSLGWAHLNKTKPDVEAAERYVRQSLKLVPYWHYARDILLPQIEKAKPSREST